MRALITCTLLGCIVSAWPTPAQAQAPTPPAPPTPATGDSQALERKIAAQQKELDAQRKKLDALVNKQAEREKRAQEVARQVKRLADARKADELEKLKKLSAGVNKRFKPSFRIFGFTDFNLIKRFPVKDDQFSRIIMLDAASFYMLSANLYAVSRITRSLSTMMELRFTYQPQGDMEGFEVHLKNGDDVTWVDGTSYQRVDRSFKSRVTGMFATEAGLVIERLHIDYQVADWLKFTLGRFLTPYGIWNIDHGSPVVLPATVPYLQRGQVVPSSQTGILVSGRYYLMDKLRLDYGVMLTNGRGPMDEVQDVDDHFAYGLRLRLVYESDKFKLAVGAYGYYGRLKDQKVSLVVDLQTEEALARFDTLDHKDEFIYSVDLLLELYGFRLQGEYAYRYTRYRSPSVPIGRAVDSVAQTALGVSGDGVPPDFYTHGGYLLLAYSLPLRRWIGAWRITPFAGYEYHQERDIEPSFTIWRAGVNVRPLPSLVFKAQWEGLYSDLLGDIHKLTLQMAVAF